MYEPVRVTSRKHLFGVSSSGLDEIPQNIVVFDLERRDACLAGVVRLKTSDNATPLVAKQSCFVELSVEAGGDVASISRKKRRIPDKGAFKHVQKVVEARKLAKPGTHDFRHVAGKKFRDFGNLGESIPDGRQITRPATTDCNS